MKYTAHVVYYREERLYTNEEQNNDLWQLVYSNILNCNHGAHAPNERYLYKK